VLEVDFGFVGAGAALGLVGEALEGDFLVLDAVLVLEALAILGLGPGIFFGDEGAFFLGDEGAFFFGEEGALGDSVVFLAAVLGATAFFVAFFGEAGFFGEELLVFFFGEEVDLVVFFSFLSFSFVASASL